jgi:hypothetical protein
MEERKGEREGGKEEERQGELGILCRIPNNLCGDLSLKKMVFNFPHLKCALCIVLSFKEEWCMAMESSK